MKNYKKSAFWLIIIAVFAVIIASVCLLTDPKSDKDREETTAATEETSTDPVETEPVLVELTPEHIKRIETLRETYPEYFDLPTENGLDVYVWQMAQSSYYCGLLPTREEGYEIIELMPLKSISMKDMKLIVLSYFPEITTKDVSIKLTYMPHSSYLYNWDEGSQQAVENMFWGIEPVISDN